MSALERRAERLLREWEQSNGDDAAAALRSEDLRGVAEYVNGLEAELRRLRQVVEGVDYELSKALDGTGLSETVERIRKVLRDARSVPRPSD